MLKLKKVLGQVIGDFKSCSFLQWGIDVVFGFFQMELSLKLLVFYQLTKETSYGWLPFILGIMWRGSKNMLQGMVLKGKGYFTLCR